MPWVSSDPGSRTDEGVPALLSLQGGAWALGMARMVEVGMAGIV